MFLLHRLLNLGLAMCKLIQLELQMQARTSRLPEAERAALMSSKIKVVFGCLPREV